MEIILAAADKPDGHFGPMIIRIRETQRVINMDRTFLWYNDTGNSRDL
jgi:hypothetical protein